MVRAMKRGGFMKVLEVHPNVNVSLDNIHKKYPERDYSLKWYTNHLGYQCLFVRKREHKSATATEPNYKQGIIKRLDGQIEKGVAKYNKVLENNTELSSVERIEHLAEELTDGLMYIEHLKKYRTDMYGELISLSTDMLINSERWTSGQFACRLNDIIKRYK
ncbi:hypothetical protein BpsS140_00055 [Bacillus phage vB_BpsS-140]|nr:hypothetical protein BpsS140_00055 [Bacillus phage vB_BpsS-140]